MPVERADCLGNHLLPGNAERREPFVGVEVGEVCVTRLLDELNDTELARDRVVLLLRRTAKMGAAELSLPGCLAFDRRDDDLRQGERPTLPRHAMPPFG